MFLFDEKADETKLALINKAFPLCVPIDFEALVNRSSFAVGINLYYPAELLEIISAAIVTYEMGNNSVDYMRKKMALAVKYEEDPGGLDRVDRTARKKILNVFGRASQLIDEAIGPDKRENHTGLFIAHHTLRRVAVAAKAAIVLADRGYFFEVASVVRSHFEQMVWSLKISEISDRETVFSTKITNSISDAKKKNLAYGKFYGWLSEHTHWNTNVHTKSFIIRNGTVHQLYASSYFKCLSCELLLLLSIIFCFVCESVSKNVNSEISKDISILRVETFDVLRSILKFALSEGDMNKLSAIAAEFIGDQHG